jgi:hypothetical protein
MLDGWRKTDGRVLKKLPVEADVPEFLVKLGLQVGASAKDKAVGDLSLIAFYYLLRIGEYTIKGAMLHSLRGIHKAPSVNYPVGQTRNLSCPPTSLVGQPKEWLARRLHSS